MPISLTLLNLLRWFKEYAISWGLLSFIYSLTLTLILQPLLEKAFGQELPFEPLWIGTCVLLLIPGVLENLPLPSISFQRGRVRFMAEGALSEKFWSRENGRFARLYLLHELRRGSNWLTLVLTVFAGSLLPQGKMAFWVLLCQLPLQRALYSIHRWRKLALGFHPHRGASNLLLSLMIAQVIQVLITWASLGAMLILPLETWLRLGPASLGAVVAASAVAMEGDSGRPWLVNFMALAAGALGGYLCLAYPLALPLVFYFWIKLSGAVAGRLHSVENLDEDSLIP